MPASFRNGAVASPKPPPALGGAMKPLGVAVATDVSAACRPLLGTAGNACEISDEARRETSGRSLAQAFDFDI